MFELLAHRGASKEAPENTLSAFKRALDMGVDWIELDVHLSADGVPVVVHDAALGRTSNGPRGQLISHTTLQNLATYDAGSWFSARFAGEAIPTLEQVLSLEHKDTGFMVELKKGHTPAEEMASAVSACLRKVRNKRKVVIGSFCPYIVEEIRRQSLGIDVMGIVDDLDEIDSFRSLQVSRLALWYKLITPALVDFLHTEGTNIWAFTVDDMPTAKSLASIGVKGLITNDVRRMLPLSPRFTPHSCQSLMPLIN